MGHVDASGRRLAGPGFPGDTGQQDPQVAATLTAYAAGRAGFAQALAALADSRVLVPVVAVLGEVAYDDGPGGTGLAQDKSSDMATVLITGADGRQALLAFTSTATLRAWQADARPVPVTLRDAARAAVQDGASALVVDLAGPVTVAIEERDLHALASGWRLAFVGGSSAWVAPGDAEPEASRGTAAGDDSAGEGSNRDDSDSGGILG